MMSQKKLQRICRAAISSCWTERGVNSPRAGDDRYRIVT